MSAFIFYKAEWKIKLYASFASFNNQSSLVCWSSPASGKRNSAKEHSTIGTKKIEKVWFLVSRKMTN